MTAQRRGRKKRRGRGRREKELRGTSDFEDWAGDENCITRHVLRPDDIETTFLFCWDSCTSYHAPFLARNSTSHRLFFFFFFYPFSCHSQRLPTHHRSPYFLNQPTHRLGGADTCLDRRLGPIDYFPLQSSILLIRGLGPQNRPTCRHLCRPELLLPCSCPGREQKQWIGCLEFFLDR